jgi:hypothetical protein
MVMAEQQRTDLKQHAFDQRAVSRPLCEKLFLHAQHKLPDLPGDREMRRYFMGESTPVIYKRAEQIIVQLLDRRGVKK